MTAALTLSCGALAYAAINPGDQLSVKVFNHPELSSDSLRVDASGAISVPVVGTVSVAGLEAGDVSRILTKKLAPYVHYPAVDVRDTTSSTVVFVAGGPGGVVQYSAGETLATALADVEKELQRAQVGGTTTSTNTTDSLDRSRIDIKRVVLIRSGKKLGSFDMVALRKVGNPGPAIYPNDTISFADKPVAVNVLGDVGAPGKAYLWQDEPLSDAVAQAGGLNTTAAIGRIELTRGDEASRLVAIGDPAFTKPAVPGDTVVIPTAPRVTVAGMVYQPGITTLKNDFTLLAAMYTAGGISKWANLKDVQVTDSGVTTHYDVTKLTHGDTAQNPPLHDGDTVFVPEGHKIDFTSIFGSLLGAGNLAANAAR